MISLFKKKQTDHALFELAGEELATKDVKHLHKGSWSRALEKAKGDEEKARGYYVSFRVEFLKKREEQSSALQEALKGSKRIKLDAAENHILNVIENLKTLGYRVSVKGDLFREYVVIKPQYSKELCKSDDQFLSYAQDKISQRETFEKHHKEIVKRLYEEYGIYTHKGRDSTLNKYWTIERQGAIQKFDKYDDFLNFAKNVLVNDISKYKSPSN
jgi:hypothetical protein